MNAPHGKNLRKGRYSEPGRAYVITMVTAGRKPVFRSFARARSCVRVFMAMQHGGTADTFAFVVMPDHIHWLCRLRSRPLAKTVEIYRSLVTRNIRRESRLEGRLWQRGFHDRAIREEEDLVAAARYIIANPVRAGLVESVRLYPHWDCVWVADPSAEG